MEDQSQQIQVHIPGGPDLQVDRFDIPDDPLLVGKAWEDWLLDLEASMDYYLFFSVYLILAYVLFPWKWMFRHLSLPVPGPELGSM